MALRAGSRLGHYEVTAKLGEGGMGQVYRAIDTQLNRMVALKILPDAFAADADRLARFRREAHILASLNHPGIAAIHGLEETPASGESGQPPTLALVLELVEGPTLADRIARGRLPLAETLVVADQIAKALEAAHEAGVIHRDLKPSNIKIREDGTVKVLDFGLAKAVAPPIEHASDATTTSGEGTETEAALGTAPYMSPEQARGRRVDKRTDIWAFGCCLYEMLTGQRAFQGATRGDVMARIFGEEPDWTALPADTPAPVRDVLWRCLRKDPRDRLRDIGDARLDPAANGHPPIEIASRAAVPSGRGAPAWRAALILGFPPALLAAFLFFGRPDLPPTDEVARRTSILIRDAEPSIDGATGVVISPDGRTLAFLARTNGRAHIRVRPIDRHESREVPGTDGAVTMFFAPHSRELAFYVRDRQTGFLKRVSFDEERVRDICETSQFYGGSWGPAETIVYAGASGLFRVPAGGGTPQAVSTVLADQGEFSHRFPHVLPDGRHVLFTIGTGGDFDAARLAILDLESRTHQILSERGSAARYLGSGHLAYALGGALRVVPFDVDRRQVTGSAVRLDEPIRTDSLFGSANFSVSNAGTLVYAPYDPRSARPTRIVWLGPDGIPQPTGLENLAIQSPRISPDGTRLAVVITQGSKNDIWIYDLQRATVTRDRFTTAGNNVNPIWSFDGSWLYFGSDRGGTFNMYRRRIDRPDETAEPIFESREFQQLQTAVTRDGTIVFNRYSPSNNVDIWLIPGGDIRNAREFLATPAAEGSAAVSPDGNWIAYVSDRTGQFEVYLSAFPDGGREVLVSSGGGQEPSWTPDGTRIVYRRDQAFMSVTIGASPLSGLGPEQPLFERRLVRRNPREYDIARDGRIIALEDVETAGSPTEIVVVDGWFSDLRRLFERPQ